MVPAPAMMGLQIGASLINAYAQNKAVKREAEAAMKSAASRYNATLGQMENVYRQTNEQATSRGAAILRQARQESSSMFAHVADAGVSGGSIDRLAYANAFAASDDLSANEAQRNNAQMQNFQSALGAKDQFDSEVNRAQAFWKKNKPTWLGLTMQIGSALAGGATQAAQMSTGVPGISP